MFPGDDGPDVMFLGNDDRMIMFPVDGRMMNGLLLVIQLTRLKRCISELSGGVGLCPAGMFCQHNILVFAGSDEPSLDMVCIRLR